MHCISDVDIIDDEWHQSDTHDINCDIGQNDCWDDIANASIMRKRGLGAPPEPAKKPKFDMCKAFVSELDVVLKAIDDGTNRVSLLVQKIQPHSDWNRFIDNVFSPHQCNVSCFNIKQIFTNVFPGTTNTLLPIIHKPLITYTAVIVCLYKADVAIAQQVTLEKTDVFVTFVTPMKTISKTHTKEWLIFWDKLIDYIADNSSAPTSVVHTLYLCGKPGHSKKHRIVHVNSVDRLAAVLATRYV